MLPTHQHWSLIPQYLPRLHTHNCNTELCSCTHCSFPKRILTKMHFYFQSFAAVKNCTTPHPLLIRRLNFNSQKHAVLLLDRLYVVQLLARNFQTLSSSLQCLLGFQADHSTTQQRESSLGKIRNPITAPSPDQRHSWETKARESKVRLTKTYSLFN